MQFETRCVHVGVDKDSAYLSATTPIYPSSTFRWDDLNTNRGFDYTRSGNPTRRALEENLAALEGGIDCRATCTGMAAIAATMHLFQPGDHIIAGHDIYGGTYRLFDAVFRKMGLEFSFVRMGDPENVRRAMTSATRGVWIETPSNPLLNIVDIAAICRIARAGNAISITDNTFLSPYLQRPFDHGCDIVVHSTTKYLITKQKDHSDKIGYLVNALGLGCSPFDAWLVLRGVKTLGPRMEAHQRGAMIVAKFLQANPHVQRVYFPGLPDHPQHELAKRQQKGFGAMLSFDVRGGRPRVEQLLAKLKIFQLAESLGGVESLIEYPDTMSHASMNEAARREAGISENTLRVSVGIEHPDDLVADFEQAFE